MNDICVQTGQITEKLYVDLLNSRHFMETLNFKERAFELSVNLDISSVYRKVAGEMAGQYAETNSINLFHSTLNAYGALGLVNCLSDISFRRLEPFLLLHKKSRSRKQRTLNF